MQRDNNNNRPVSPTSSMTVGQDICLEKPVNLFRQLNISREMLYCALKDPLARIPAELQPHFLDFHNQHHRRFLLQINLLGQLAYWSYGFADWLMLPDVGMLSILLRSLYIFPAACVTLLLYRYSRNISLLDLLLPLSIVGATILWFEVLTQSQSPDVATFQYASVISIILANLSTQIRFWPVLLISLMITGITFWGVFRTSAGQLHAVFIFALVYLPIMLFSLYISWSTTLKNRQIFLRHILDKWNHQALDQLAHTDVLTNLDNRRQFERLACSELARLQRKYQPTCLLMLDVDHFKQINDNYGHEIGDQVLKRISQIAQDNMREQDLLARFGGEEFIALLPNTTLEEAEIAAERLRCQIAESKVITPAGDVIQFTVSMGITLAKKNVQDLHELINSADQALYQAKQHGRNRVMIFVSSRQNSRPLKKVENHEDVMP